jgi:hypothetical protein
VIIVLDMLTRAQSKLMGKWVSDVNAEMEQQERPAVQPDVDEQSSDGSSTLRSDSSSESDECLTGELQSLEVHQMVKASSPSGSAITSVSRASSASTTHKRLQLAQSVAEAERKMAKKARKRDEEELARVRRLAALEEQLAEEEELESRSQSVGSGTVMGRQKDSSHENTAHTSRQDEPNLASQIAEAFEARSSLPKQEITPFAGKACDYNRFVHAFETMIEQNAIPLTTQAKLRFLIQFCEGEAKQCIEDCILLPPEEGYTKAKELLLANFGRPWTIAENFVQHLTEGPAIKANDQAALKALSLDLTKCELNLHHVGFKEHLDGPQTILKIVERLPYALRNKWAELAHRKTSKGKIVSIRDLTKFIREREAVAASLYGRQLNEKSRRTEQAKKRDAKAAAAPRAATFTASGEERPKYKEKKTLPKTTKYAGIAASNPNLVTHCPGCQGTCQSVANCPSYAQQSYGERKKMILEYKLCFNCLKPSHMVSACKLPSQCNVSGCRGKHHATMHLWRPLDSDKEDTAATTATSAGGYLTSSSAGRVLLGIIPVRVRGANGKDVVTNALMDNGSSQSFCSEDLRRQLGIKGKEVKYTLSTLTAENVPATATEVELQVLGMTTTSPVQLNSVWSVPELRVSVDRAVRADDLKIFSHLHDLKISPPVGSHVGLLIGANSSALVPIDVRCPPSPGQPYAELTQLGWVVRGPTSATSHYDRHQAAHWAEADPLETSLQRMWRTEFADHLACGRNGLSLEDKDALRMLEESVKHDGERYEICLPWRNEQPCLPNNRLMAEKRLQSLKHRLLRDEELLKGYTRQMDSYLEQGHAVAGAVAAKEDAAWFLPHHPVIHPAKPGKVRIVFDGAATYRGISINSSLLSGPDLTNELVGVLIRFRHTTLPYALT